MRRATKISLWEYIDLKNTGEKRLVTDFYNHNFFNVDGDTVGPNYSFVFPCEVKAKDPKGKFSELVALDKKEFHFKDKLPTGDFVMAGLTGFDPKDDGTAVVRDAARAKWGASEGRTQLLVREVQRVGHQDDHLPRAVHGDRPEAGRRGEVDNHLYLHARPGEEVRMAESGAVFLGFFKT